MNNTELTLDQLSEIAGGPAYGMDNSSFTSNKLETFMSSGGSPGPYLPGLS